MPIFEYTGPTPSEPVTYTMEGLGAPTVEGRVFETGEHVSAVENPDPSLFTETGEQTVTPVEAERAAAAAPAPVPEPEPEPVAPEPDAEPA